MRALPPGDEWRPPTRHRAERAHRAVHAAGDDLLGLLKKLLG